MKILVTGANGFVGSNLVEKLLKEGHQVKCLVHKNITWLDRVPKEYSRNVEIVRGSVTRIETLHTAVKNVEAVFHTAGVLRAVRPETYYLVNQTGTKNLIEAVYRLNPKIKRFVYLSSQAAMGPASNCNPKDPASRCEPVSEYGWSKLAGEKEILKFNTKLPVTILRPSAIYGPRDKDIFPFFKFAARYRVFPVLTPSNACLVQVLLVNDLAEVCALIAARHQLQSEIYFVSENRHYTWPEIGRALAAAAGVDKIRMVRVPFFILEAAASISEAVMKIKNKPAAFNRDKLGEFCQKYWISDSSAVEKEFGFKFTSLETGARITYNWYKENGWL
jgi:nucleoside-diphosphate-sugar epimerase